jgi:hypothetical protein
MKKKSIEKRIYFLGLGLGVGEEGEQFGARGGKSVWKCV